MSTVSNDHFSWCGCINSQARQSLVTGREKRSLRRGYVAQSVERNTRGWEIAEVAEDWREYADEENSLGLRFLERQLRPFLSFVVWGRASRCKLTGFTLRPLYVWWKCPDIFICYAGCDQEHIWVKVNFSYPYRESSPNSSATQPVAYWVAPVFVSPYRLSVPCHAIRFKKCVCLCS